MKKNNKKLDFLSKKIIFAKNLIQESICIGH